MRWCNDIRGNVIYADIEGHVEMPEFHWSRRTSPSQYQQQVTHEVRVGSTLGPCQQRLHCVYATFLASHVESSCEHWFALFHWPARTVPNGDVEVSPHFSFRIHHSIGCIPYWSNWRFHAYYRPCKSVHGRTPYMIRRSWSFTCSAVTILSNMYESDISLILLAQNGLLHVI